MPKNITRLLTVVTVLSLVCVGIVPVVAQDGDRPPDLHLEVDEAGNWVLTVEGVEEQLRSEDVEALSAALGLGLPRLSLGPDIVSRASNSGIGYAALAKEGEQFTVFLNDSAVAALAAREGIISTLTDQLAPQMAQAVAFLLSNSSIGITARFPGAVGDPPDLTSRVAVPTDVEARSNVIDLGLTMSPDGEIISIAGIDAATLGMSGTLVDLSPFRGLIEQWSIETAGVDVVANTVGLSVNGSDWLSLALNLDYLRDNLGSVTGLAGMQLGDREQQLVAVGTDWLADTEVHVDAYLASQSQEAPARLALGRPVSVAIRDNAVLVEGFNTGFALDAMTAGYLEKLGSVALVWDGDQREVRWLVAQEPMPVIAFDEGFLQTVGTAFIGEAVAPWGLIDGLLGNVRLAGDVVYEDNPRSPAEALDYQVAARTPPLGMRVDLKVSRSNGGVSVWGIPLPLSSFAPGVPDMVRTYANQYGGLGGVVVDLGPSGATVNLAGSQAHVRWDAETRANALALAVDTLGPDLGLPPALQTDRARSALQGVVSFVNAFGIGIDITVVDEAIEQGPLDRLLGLFM
ncbi:MAG: hypothetical protein HPY83_05405 [Anaerolineae bacterium]|nr:hypothetical protein [Anaerolineae bacterium]